MTSHYDYLIVGSGLYGATVSYRLRKAGKSCLVIDKRHHAGGNIYCEDIEGINVHRYGAHIFHTSDRDVWQFVTDLVEFNRYTNSPVAMAPDGNLYNLPFNMNTFSRLWGVKTPAEARAELDRQTAEARAKLQGEPRNLEEQALSLIGRDVYELLIKGYTQKQWGRPCSELPAFIIRRLPVRLVFDNNYFNDPWQGIPIGGYNRLIDKLLEGVEVRLDTDYFADRAHWDSVADHLVFTGPIDQFFDYRHGVLQYRSVRFEDEILNTSNYQGNAVVNYTGAEVPFTRVIEHKHFEAFGQTVYDNPKTVISREYSSEWAPGIEPYYPVNDDRNTAILQKYEAEAARLPNVHFGGRLGQYKYYDMDKVIRQALDFEI